MNDSFYRAFEDRHRGSRDLIKSRLRAYEPFVKLLSSLPQPATALDVGCGRGEWLELLGELGVDAFGVDLDAGMLAACQERGLNTRQEDALETLRTLPSDSLSMVSAFHVVEHIPFDALQAMVREALRALKPGGLLILETPNPENLVVGASDFYMDPSHERPIPSQLLSFVVEHAGYRRTKIVRLQEAPELHRPIKIRLLNVLNGVSPDYSIVAQKDGPPEVLSLFDRPFQKHFGISLETLAQYYDFQTENRLADLRDAIELTNAQAEAYATREAVRTTLVEERLARVEALQLQLNAILNSRSWRITAPLRMLAGNLRRMRAAVQEDRIASGIKRRTKSALVRIGRSILQQPALFRAALLVLDRLPSLKGRLRNIIYSDGRPVGAPKLSPLSPRAQDIYAQLKKAIAARKN